MPHKIAQKGKTLPLALMLSTLIASFSSGPVQAGQTVLLPADNPLARQFAYCAGRLSAEAAHREDRDLNALKLSMQELLAALIDPNAAASYEELRIAGHVSQTELLAQSRFSFDKDVATRAAGLADQNIQKCRQMLLGG